jgi:hypothetical protein
MGRACVWLGVGRARIVLLGFLCGYLYAHFTHVSVLGVIIMKWEILFQWHDELNDPPRTAIVSDDPLSLEDDAVMYTLDADEVANGIVGDYLDFKILKATEALL